MTGIQNSKLPRFVVKYQLSDRYVSKIGFSDLDIIWNLGIGIWDFNTGSGKG